MSVYQRFRHSGTAFWVVVAWVTVELVLGWGMVLGFWFTGVAR